MRALRLLCTFGCKIVHSTFYRFAKRFVIYRDTDFDMKGLGCAILQIHNLTYDLVNNGHPMATSQDHGVRCSATWRILFLFAQSCAYPSQERDGQGLDTHSLGPRCTSQLRRGLSVRSDFWVVGSLLIMLGQGGYNQFPFL